MQDLTQGSITRHIVSMAVFIGLGLVFQTLYFLVDLYFVSRLGSAAIAGVSAAGVSSFLVMGFSQLIGVGAMALTAQAVGRKDQAAADLVSSQALSLSFAFAAATLVIGYAFGVNAVAGIGADEATGQAAREYLGAFLPSLAIMFPTVALGTALRAAGVVRPTMFLQTGTILVNAILAPVLIAGWGTGVPLGVAGAGWASTIATIVGLIGLIYLFPRVQSFIRIHVRDLKPDFQQWAKIVGIGVPAAAEFILMFVIFGVVYWVIRHFGPHAQAGFGVGMRIMQSIFLPAMAIAFAAAPIAGQNFGAGQFDRVRETFRRTAIICCSVMFGLTLFAQIAPQVLVRPFIESDPEAMAVAVVYLRIASWNFVASGLIFTCSSLFQGLGDTRPSFIASASRLITFALPAIWLAGQGWATLEEIWYLSVASVFLQAGLVFLLMRGVLKKKLGSAAVMAAPA